MPTIIDPTTLELAPRISEPPPTDEDRRMMDETWARIREENRLAREAGERLPPITEDIWGVNDLK